MMLKDILCRTANAGLKIQGDDGSFPPGHNGPWHNKETPIRNTAHWILTLAKAHDITGDTDYEEGLRKAGSYLASDACCPMGRTFMVFTDGAMYGGSNGLVGQAWVMEALLTMYRKFGEERFLQLAEERALDQPWDAGLRIWRALSPQGEDMGIQWSLNQQIWFSALSRSVYQETGNEKINERVKLFSDRIPTVANFWKGFIRMRLREYLFIGRPKFFYRIMKSRVRNHHKLEARSQGYIAYSYYPLSILHNIAPELEVWQKKSFLHQFRSSLNFMEENVINYTTEDNPYAYTYHPTGFEMACILESFTDIYKAKTTPAQWVQKQLDQHYDPDTDLMTRNTVDPMTLAARFYEASRIRDMDMEVHV